MGRLSTTFEVGGGGLSCHAVDKLCGGLAGSDSAGSAALESYRAKAARTAFA